jgi:DNA replication protein DnaC
MRGSEAIKIIGNEFIDGFSIDKEPLLTGYRLVYENLSSGLDVKSKTKGLLIIGSIGVGKSLMMRIYQKLFKDSCRAFKWVSASVLRDMLDETTLSNIKASYGYDCKMDLYIDDVGVSHSDVKRYGNTVNVISEILMERYELFCNEGYKTHISTNLLARLENNPQNIPTMENYLSNRVYDRIKEMCELVVINGQSLRK